MLDSLTPEQRAIATALDGTTLVLAAVGAGKTTTMTARIRHAVALGYDPARILALTFTNRAAQQMRTSLGDDARRVQLRTFHGLCAWILRSEAPAAGLPPDFWIYDEDDSAELARELGVHDPVRALYTFHADASAVAMGCARPDLWYKAAFTKLPWGPDYVAALAERGAVDFAGLVLLARAVLGCEPASRARWETRFDAVYVDEVQDTHLSEYEVVHALARLARSRAFVGDLDQSIYGWRGSRPERLVPRLEADLGPVRRFPLDENFRATRALLRFADRVASRFETRATNVRPHASLPEGEDPACAAFADEDAEHDAIARGCAAAIARGVPAERIAVLTRTNALVGSIVGPLARHGVPHITVERFRFFRRAEIKDALALLTLAVDPRAEGAARRVAHRLVPGVGSATLGSIVTDGSRAGLRVSDLLDPVAVRRGDPLWGLTLREFVVLDTETTGLDVATDEVVEIAAVRVRDGREVDRFAALLRPTRPVGGSVKVHGLTDERLAAEGIPAAVAFARLGVFVGDTPVAGHNLGFDLAMLKQNALLPCFDTLAVARRLLAAPSYRLADLATALGLAATPSHRALDDVRATVALAGALAERAADGAATRVALMHRHAGAFEPLREAVARWRALEVTPGELLRTVIAEFKLREHQEPDRLRHLDELIERVERLAEPGRRGPRAAQAVLERVSLVREVDLLDEERGVRVITVHQAKGMEFDEVFVPGLVEGGFPSFMATREGNVEEERRLFYVAITRARRRLHLSWARRNGKGWATRPSPFLP